MSIQRQQGSRGIYYIPNSKINFKNEIERLNVRCVLHIFFVKLRHSSCMSVPTALATYIGTTVFSVESSYNYSLSSLIDSRLLSTEKS